MVSINYGDEQMKELYEKLYRGTSESYYLKLSKYLDNNEKKCILTANPEMFSIAKHNDVIKKGILNKDYDVVTDGIAIKATARFYKVHIPERITGIDITKKLLEFGNQKKKTIYLFGAEKKVLEKLEKDIKEKYKGLKIVGATNGYVKDKEAEIKKIIQKEPDICLVALGIPTQEEIILSIMPHVKKGIYIGVGGTFDVLSGYKKRAPEFYIKHNMEWFYRIASEPKRIPRFLKYNILFCFKTLFDSKK